MSDLAIHHSPTRVATDVIESREQVNMTTIDLLPQVANGEPAAVSQCIKRYGNLVWSLARRSISDQQAAEDAVQEIFLKLWEVAQRFDPTIASETTFVAMIARRKLIDINRRKKLPVAPSVEFDAFEGGGEDAAKRAEVCDEAAKAAELLTQLPIDQQRVIKLSVYDGLSHSKIAESTGLSLGTVKTHIRRGFIKLRSMLFASPEYCQDNPTDLAGKEEN